MPRKPTRSPQNNYRDPEAYREYQRKYREKRRQQQLEDYRAPLGHYTGKGHRAHHDTNGTLNRLLVAWGLIGRVSPDRYSGPKVG